MNANVNNNLSTNLVQCISSEYISSMSALASRDIVVVYVESWDDVAFWRNIFDDFADSGICFEIMPPVRSDLAKGKKVVLDFSKNAGPHLFLAVDSDFDWIFNGKTSTSHKMKECKWLVQTYAYSIENLQCVPSSLSSVLSKITRVDFPYFDFNIFFRNYSKSIYKLFVWYVWSAFAEISYSLPISRFAKAVKVANVDFADNGINTLASVSQSSSKLLKELYKKYPEKKPQVTSYEEYLNSMGIDDTNVYFFIQGHTLKDCVVKPLLLKLAAKIIDNQSDSIKNSNLPRTVVENQLNCYKNSTKPVESVLEENLGYKKTKLYEYIFSDIYRMINQRNV